MQGPEVREGGGQRGGHGAGVVTRRPCTGAACGRSSRRLCVGVSVSGTATKAAMARGAGGLRDGGAHVGAGNGGTQGGRGGRGGGGRGGAAPRGRWAPHTRWRGPARAAYSTYVHVLEGVARASGGSCAVYNRNGSQRYSRARKRASDGPCFATFRRVTADRTAPRTVPGRGSDGSRSGVVCCDGSTTLSLWPAYRPQSLPPS